MSTDRRTIQLVVIILGLIALVGICGVVFLLSTGHKAADLGPLTSPMSVAIGAVAALLVSTRTGNDPQPQPQPPAPAAPVQAQLAAPLPGAPDLVPVWPVAPPAQPIGQSAPISPAPPSTPSG